MRTMRWSLTLAVVGLFIFVVFVLANGASLTKVCGEDQFPYESVDTDNLEAVIVFMRHGVRAPWTTYPKDPNVNNTSRWPNGRSQLTSFGIQQAIHVGDLLGKRYGNFIRNQTRNQIFLRASAAQRCIDTLNLVASRLWTNYDVAHQPVVYSLPKPIDSVLYEEPDCPEADDEEANNMNEPVVSQYENLTDIKDLYSYVAEHTGLAPTMSGVTKAFDCVRCDKINGYKMPWWSSINDVYERMGQVYTKNLNFLYASQKSLRFRAGPMLHDVIDTINSLKSADASTAESFRRIHLYTTHDYKISALLLALGETLYKYPPFAATVMFEVRRNSINDLVLEAFYISQTVKVPYTIESLRLSQCLDASDFQCKFSNFVSYLKPFANVSWTKECGLTGFDAIQAAENSLGDN